MIEVAHVSRHFRVMDRSRGIAGALRDLLRTEARTCTAVADLSFTIPAGEAVALIGPNGAGKSTTIKMLTGILQPSAGTVRVGGLDPWTQRARHVRQIGVVFGQRTQLWWDLAVIEALDLIAAMFEVPSPLYRERLSWLSEVLGIGPLLRTPVRQLSLGERMRCELAAALLHAPPLLFLDEPTIGLDVAVKLRLRAFLSELRDRGDTTLLLTTHDLADVTALCPRVMLISHGRLLHDGSMAALAAQLGGRRSLHVQFRAPLSDDELAAFGVGLPSVVRTDVDAVRITVPSAAPSAPELIRLVLEKGDIADLKLEDPSIEELIARFYEGAAR